MKHFIAGFPANIQSEACLSVRSTEKRLRVTTDTNSLICQLIVSRSDEKRPRPDSIMKTINGEKLFELFEALREAEELLMEINNLESGVEGIKTRPLETEGRSRRNKAGTDASFKTYVCEYYHNGSWWGLEIMAPDLADAEARVAKLGNLKLKGELMATIPSFHGAGWFVRATCAIRNFFCAK